MKTAWMMVGALVLLSAQSARAQEDCRADSDCGVDRRCEKPISIDGCEEPPCDAKPVEGEVGWCVPAALNSECTSDADCGDELVCIQFDLDEPCASDTPECGGGASRTESSCQYPPPEPLLCDENDSCAPPFACDTEMDEPACYYPDLSCEDDSDCAADFECVDGAVFAGECASCDDPGDGGEPVCSTEPCEPGPSQCAPKLIACSADSDCPAEWLCREISYNYQAPQWDADVIGTMGCVPGGLVQVDEGNYYLGGGIVTLDSGGLPVATLASASGLPTDSAAEAGGDDTPAKSMSSMSSSSGCAISAPGKSSAAGSSLVVLGLALLGLRVRRRRAQ